MVACLQHGAREPEPDASGPHEHTVKPRDYRAAHVYQGRWLDFLVVVYSLQACEDPSMVGCLAWQPSIYPDLALNVMRRKLLFLCNQNNDPDRADHLQPH
jgi:hypothetical protein